MISGENFVPRRRSTQRQVFQEYTRLALRRILSQFPKFQDHHTLMFVLAQFNENILLQKDWIWIFPWCRKARFQIPPLCRSLFLINTTTILGRFHILLCLSQKPLYLKLPTKTIVGIIHHFSPQTQQLFSGIWLKFWHKEALIWMETGEWCLISKHYSRPGQVCVLQGTCLSSSPTHSPCEREKEIDTG